MEVYNPMHKQEVTLYIYNIVNDNKYEILNKLISILLHVSIMIIFEIYFYFNYIVVIEKNLFISKMTSYINQLYDIKIDYYFNKQLNNYKSILYKKYIESLVIQQDILNQLLYYSCSIAAFIVLPLVVFLFIGLFNYKQLKWRWLIVENIIMFTLLAMFEYLFFTNVIMKYTPLTNDELKYIIYNAIINHFNGTTT
jgi:hypothetical protein